MSELQEPKNRIVITKFNTDGEWLRHEMIINGKFTVKTKINDRFVNVIRIDGKYPENRKRDFYEVKITLSEYYPELSIGYIKQNTK